jgi:hypothetical protein
VETYYLRRKLANVPWMCYVSKNLILNLQGRVKFPTGGKIRELNVIWPTLEHMA